MTGAALARIPGLHFFRICSVLAVSLAAPYSAAADCVGTWDLSGRLWLSQTNNSPIYVDIEQRGAEIRGRAGDSSGTVFPARRIDDGTISGNRFSFTINWGTGSVGVYTGLIDEWGWVSGATEDRNTRARATWIGDRAAKCKSDKEGFEDMLSSTAVCTRYTNDAVAAATFNRQRGCGNTGSRWSRARSHHLNWCMGLGNDLRQQSNSETGIRAEAIKVCIARAGARTQSPGDVVSHEKVGVDTERGDVVVKPPPVLKKKRRRSVITKPEE